MIEFTKLSAINYGPFPKLSLPLRRRGMVLITGDNHDSDAASSNGSGKSHVLGAITWGLFGQEVDGTSHDSMIRIGQDGCIVEVGWVEDERHWAVRRMRRRGRDPLLVLLQDGKDVSLRTTKDTQEEINRLLGLDFQTWKNTVIYAQGDLVRFADPRTTDTERKMILKRILRIDVLDRALERARAQVREMEQIDAGLDARQVAITSELRGMGDTSTLAAQITNLQEELGQLHAKVKREPKLKQALASIQTHLDDVNRSKGEIDALRQKASTFSRQGARLEAEADAMTREIRRLQEQAIQLEGGECPLCGSPSGSLHVLERVTSLRQQESAACGKQFGLQTEANSLKEQARACELSVNELKVELAGADEWVRKSGELKAELRQVDLSKAEIKRKSAIVEQIQQKIKNHELKAQSLEEEHAMIQAKRDENGDTLSHYRFWIKGFSNTGLPSLMMDSVVPILGERANHYLETLSDGDITVRFDTQTELKSGEAREKISIDWIIEGVPGAKPSGGQRKKISIAVDLALMDIVASREHSAIDMLAIDECLDGLDPIGRARVALLLQELRQHRSTIIAVTQEPGLEQVFENVLVAVKENHETKLVPVQ